MGQTRTFNNSPLISPSFYLVSPIPPAPVLSPHHQMSADPKRGVQKFDEHKIANNAAPCATGKEECQDLQNKEQQHDTVEVEQRQHLSATEEQRLKKDQYNFQQSAHRHDNNPKNQHRAGGHGRDHGQLQIQERTQNH